MELGAQILYYTVWLVVAIAAGGILYHTLARRDLRRDRATIAGAGARVASEVSPLLRWVRAKSQPMTASEFRAQVSVGIRVTLWLIIPLLLLGYRYGGRQWGLVLVLCGLVIVPAFTIPFSLLHTFLLRAIGFRGPIVSSAIGLVLGVVGSRFFRDWGLVKLATTYGGIYGLIIGLGNTSLYAPGIVTDDRPRTLEEQERADGLNLT